jgi:hypothetical protein
MKESLSKRFEALVSKVTEREKDFKSVLDFIGKRTSYFVAPASPKYHLNCEEGLLEHSINVAENMIRIKQVLAPEITDESCVIVGLMHDLGKAGWPGKPYYKIKEPTSAQKKYGFSAYPPYEYNEDCKPYMAVPDRSLAILAGKIYLSPEEWQAIRIHDGQYVQDNKSYATNECKLALIAQYADTWAGFIMEDVVIKYGSKR